MCAAHRMTVFSSFMLGRLRLRWWWWWLLLCLVVIDIDAQGLEVAKLFFTPTSIQWSRVHFKKIAITQLVKKFSVFSAAWKFMTVLVPILSQINPVNFLLCNFFKMKFNIILPSTHRSPKVSSLQVLCPELCILICLVPALCSVCHILLGSITVKYLVKSSSYIAAHYASIPILLLFIFSSVQIFSKWPCSETWSAYLIPSIDL
jgi:hypothetical protein